MQGCWKSGPQKFGSQQFSILGSPILSTLLLLRKTVSPSLHVARMARTQEVRTWRLIGSTAEEYREGSGNPLSALAWKIPWMEEPGRLQSMGSLRVGHNWGISLSLFTFTHWRRKWQPTPVFLPWESQGQGSLMGCRLSGHTELDMTEVT